MDWLLGMELIPECDVLSAGSLSPEAKSLLDEKFALPLL
jgi:hypothetical protein